METIFHTGGSTHVPLFKDMLQALLKETFIAEEVTATGPVVVAQHIVLTSDYCERLELVEEIATSTNAGDRKYH